MLCFLFNIYLVIISGITIVNGLELKIGKGKDERKTSKQKLRQKREQNIPKKFDGVLSILNVTTRFYLFVA